MSITDTLLGEAYYYLKQYYGNSISKPDSIYIPVILEKKLSQEEAEEAEINESVDKREPIGTQPPGENVLVNEHGETIAEMSVTEVPTELSEEGTTLSKILGSSSELGENQGKGTNKGVLSPSGGPPSGGPPSGDNSRGKSKTVAQRPVAQRPVAQPLAAQPLAAQPSEGPQAGGPQAGDPTSPSIDTCNENIKTLIKGGKIVEAFEDADIMEPRLDDCIKYILSIWPQDSINIKLNSGSTPLIEAVKLGDIHIVMGLIFKKPDINQSDYNGDTPIIHAARNGNTAILKLIHGQDGSLEQPTEGNGDLKETVLMNAVKSGNLDSVKYLIAAVNINEKTQNAKTAFLFACENGNLDIVKYLLTKDADMNDKDSDGFTGLMLASSTSKLDIVKFLIGERGVAIDDFNNQGNTALMVAADNGATDIVKYLISNGADVNANMDRTTGHTALMGAAAGGHKDIVNILLAKRANVNARVGPNTTNEEEGRTALMYAVESGNTEIVEILLEKGADREIKDKSDKTALMYARDRGDQDIIKILESPSMPGAPGPVTDQNNTATTIQKVARGWATRKNINYTKGNDTEIGVEPIIPDDSDVKTSNKSSRPKFIDILDAASQEAQAKAASQEAQAKAAAGQTSSVRVVHNAAAGEIQEKSPNLSVKPSNPITSQRTPKKIKVEPNKLNEFKYELEHYIPEITQINNSVDTLTEEDKTTQTQRRQQIRTRINEVQQFIQTSELAKGNQDIVNGINAQIETLKKLLIESKELMEIRSQTPSSVPSGGGGAVTSFAPVAKAYVKEVSSPRTSVSPNTTDAEVIPSGIVSGNIKKLEVTKTAPQMTPKSTGSVKEAWGENSQTKPDESTYRTANLQTTTGSELWDNLRGPGAPQFLKNFQAYQQIAADKNGEQSKIPSRQSAQTPPTVASRQAAQTQPSEKDAELKQAFNVLLMLNAQGIPTPEQIEKAESLAKDLKVDTELKYSTVLNNAKKLLNKKTMTRITGAIDAVKKYIIKFTNNEPIINSSRTLEVISRYEERLNELIRKTNDDITKKINECEKINGRYYTTDDIRGAIENLTIEIDKLKRKMDHAKNLIKKKQTEIEKYISDQATILLRAIDTLSGKIESATVKNISSIEKEYQRILNSYKELNDPTKIPAYLSSRPFYTVITEVTTKLFSLGPDIKRKKDTLEAQKSGTKVPSLPLSAATKSTLPLLQSTSAREEGSEKQQTLYSSASAPTSPRVLRADKPPEKTYDELIKELNELLEESKTLPNPPLQGETPDAEEVRRNKRLAFRTKFNTAKLLARNKATTEEQKDYLEILEINIKRNIQKSKSPPTPVRGGKKTKRTRPKQPIHTSRRCQRKIKYTNNKTTHKKPHPTNKTKNRRT